MEHISPRKFIVVPRLPARLKRLQDLAYNLWWCWNPEAIHLWIRIDRNLWLKTGQNPVQVLSKVSQVRLKELEKDESFFAHFDRVIQRLDKYMESSTWEAKNPDSPENLQVAYFSFEFGLHESISIYSGGLGVLAGDHLKSASDLGLPLVAVGLLYREGYFRQYLNSDGWQQERYPENDFYHMPLTLKKDKDGNELLISVQYDDGPVTARIWCCQVGRVPLYFLDCDIPQNNERAKAITACLYGGDLEMRLRQEIMLGIGGIRALKALGIEPTVHHINEGHAAFLILERVRQLVVEESVALDQAMEQVKASGIFTTHTPVPAGNDIFSLEMMRHHFGRLAREINMDMEHLIGLGRQNPHDNREPFCMTVLAMKMSAATNGVSKLHGEVARGMWARAWPSLPESEVPITSVTNGVHACFWISRDLAGLYDRYLGPEWVTTPDDPKLWERIDDVPDAELWRTHERRRERLVNFARRHVAGQLKQKGAPSAAIKNAREVLDPETLTIAFARRFATYKRANLFLMDPERFKRILTNPERPVQFIIAGKAHPADNQGKDLIRRIYHYSRDPEVRRHIIFVEDYDINVARYMVQGVDCWLNCPRKPMEASGTSGMKAGLNGVLNISIPDGWWCEAEFLGDNGWSIGAGETYANTDEQDRVESEALYEILEQEVVPAFYERGADGLPRQWVAKMKSAIRTICPQFNTNRMVQEYSDRFYKSCSSRYIKLRADGGKRLAALTEWKNKVKQAWNNVSISDVRSGPTDRLLFGTSLEVSADVDLDQLSIEDVIVEVYYGNLDTSGNLVEGKTVAMEFDTESEEGNCTFRGTIFCGETGQQGFTVRVIPSHVDMFNKHETGLCTWAPPESD